MKRFVFGLGNPGQKYQHTRHNVGFILIEELVRKCSGNDFTVNAREYPKLHAKLYRICDTFFAESTTYMNESGRAVQSVIEYFDKDLSAALRTGEMAGTAEHPSIILIYDDLDIQLGQYKIQFGKGPKVHNGLNSVRQYLGTDAFLHVRVGVDGRNGKRTQSGSEYVLTPFFGPEQQVLAQTLSAVSEELHRRLQ